MSYKTIPHDCAITKADLPHVKSALEVILGEEFKPTHRLEILARIAGYRTFASMKADFEPKLDLSGNPVPLYLSTAPQPGDPFIAGLPVEQRRKLHQLERVGILRMVSAALEISQDPIFGNIGVFPEDMTRIEIMAREARISRDNHSAYFADRIPAGTAFLVISPDNVADLRKDVREFRELPGQPEEGAGTSWYLAPIVIDETRPYFETPDLSDIIELKPSDFPKMCVLARDASLVFWADEDARTFEAELACRSDRAVDPKRVITCRDTALEIDDEEEGSLFSVGYFGAARMDMPDTVEQFDGAFAVKWLSEIACMVHAFADEVRRLSIGRAA